MERIRMDIVTCVVSLLTVLCLARLVRYFEQRMEEEVQMMKKSRNSRSSTDQLSVVNRLLWNGHKNTTGAEIVILDGPPGHPMVLCTNLERSLQILTQIENAVRQQHLSSLPSLSKELGKYCSIVQGATLPPAETELYSFTVWLRQLRRTSRHLSSGFARLRKSFVRFMDRG